MSVCNHLLFSEIFFQQIRGETADLDNLRATLGIIRDTWQYHLPPPSGWQGPAWTPASRFSADDVAQLRAKVVEQIFAYLGLTYGPCLTDERVFFLYADWAKEDRTGLCLVLPYSADIEGRDPETGFIPKGCNYAQQLIRLLRQHDLDWGVLTNGRHWRLFHRTELSPTDTYLHIDLERIIATNDIKSYIVFHRFFSRSAFARQDGRQRLDLYKQRSDEVTRVIEKHLSAHVEEIVRHLCQGMVESCRAAGEDVTAPERRADIYKNALFLVYRLLFVLYAEARDLLPLDAPGYQKICLRDLLTQVRDNHKRGLQYDDDYALWIRLQSLFALIDQGNVAAGVPAYNGGLFDPDRRPFLTHHHIRNEYLQKALIRLGTMPAKGKTYDQDRDPQPIDYRDLSVRHLGSLYEGLMEYNLFVVEDEPRVVHMGEKKTEYVPYSQAGKVRASETLLQIGDVYFSETAGERKATGSYYTPEDVVDYIVRHTVGEKLAELKAEFYATQHIERQLTDLADTPSSIPAHRQIQQALDDQFLRFVREKVLALKILDPAMGSGHFLVNATHTVANFITELLNETAWDNPDIDTDVASGKRHVAERCIFGVDLNELAVELAKLCLWMTTAAKGKPLTFLDHHLRWGNSLVGAWLKDVGVYPLAKKESRQAFTMPLDSFRVDLDRVLAGYRQLYAKSSDDVADVREKARIFNEEIYPALQPYQELLTLHTGIYFGNGLNEETYAKLGVAVADPTAWSRVKGQNLKRLLDQHADRHWFHWELEFPEVFFDTPSGFYAVVGNPPYVRQEHLSGDKTFLQACYSEAYSGTADTYVFFLVGGAQILREGGVLGYIVSDKWLRATYAEGLRAFLTTQVKPLQLLDFGHSDVFKNTDTFPCILIVNRIGDDMPTKSNTFLYCDVSDKKRGDRSLQKQVREMGFQIPLVNLSPRLWRLEQSDVALLMQRLSDDYPKLRQMVDAAMLNGIKTGLNQGFCIDDTIREHLVTEDPRSITVLRKLLRGRNIQRWKSQWDGEWIIAIPSSANRTWPWSEHEYQEAEEIFRDEFPAIYQYFRPFRERLTRRLDQGRFWWELRSCDYYDALTKPKIVVQGILYHSTFSLDIGGYYLLNSCYFIPTESKYLLALLNSRLMWWYAFRVLPHMKDEALHPHLEMVLDFPIPDPCTELRSEIESLVDQALLLSEKATPEGLKQLLDVEMAINNLVMQAYALSDSEVDTVNRTLVMRDPLEVLESRLSSCSMTV